MEEIGTGISGFGSMGNDQKVESNSWTECSTIRIKNIFKTILLKMRPGADAIKKFTPSLGIPYLGV